MTDLLYGVTFKVANGAMRDDAAKAAFLRAEALGNIGPIFVEFREKRYRVMLAVREVGADGQFVGEPEEAR